MRRPVVICDVCGGPVKVFSVLEVTAGPLRSVLHSPQDWCSSCCDRLLDLIRSGHQASQDALGGPLQDTAVASDGLAARCV